MLDEVCSDTVEWHTARLDKSKVPDGLQDINTDPSTDSRAKPGWPISLHNVCKKYGARQVLDQVNLDLRPGEVLAVCGPSGAGKSTLLRTINGLEPIDSGTITIGPHQIPHMTPKTLRNLRSYVGFVFQQFNLYPHKNVLDNVMLAPCLVRGIPKEQALARAHELLDWVGLSHRKHAFPVQLSGGEQQRVAIVRSLIMEPKVLLLDEPTASLDRELKFDVLQILSDLALEGRTIVLCTHELEFAESIAHRMVFMDKGRVLEVGTPAQILRSPQHERTASFMSKLTVSPQPVTA